MDLFLLSNSTNHGGEFFEHAINDVADMMAGSTELLFVPFAKRDHDAYTEVVRGAFSPLGVSVRGLHEESDKAAAIRRAGAVFVGGGNTFRLLSMLQAHGLLAKIRDQVLAGVPYIGSSAGTNLAAPTIRTTNDMPIVQPAGFAALDLIPFQINAHYLDASPASTHMGETREERITEFLEENDVVVLGLREGSWLRVTDHRAVIGGSHGARLFRRHKATEDLQAGADVADLLHAAPRFDTAYDG